MFVAMVCRVVVLEGNFVGETIKYGEVARFSHFYIFFNQICVVVTDCFCCHDFPPIEVNSSLYCNDLAGTLVSFGVVLSLVINDRKSLS